MKDMALPKGFESTDTAAKLMGVTYSQFMRLYSKEIPSLQIHKRGPRLYEQKQILRFIKKLIKKEREGTSHWDDLINKFNNKDKRQRRKEEREDERRRDVLTNIKSAVQIKAGREAIARLQALKEGEMRKG